MRLIDRLYNKKVSGLGLAIFRICYALILLGEILQLYYFRHLIFDKIPYVDLAEINFAIPIIIWGVSVVFVLIGMFTRIATLINYLMSLILIGSIDSYEYHMFYVYMGVNFLLMFLPIARNLSIDRLFLKFKYSNTRFNYSPPTDVSVLAYYIPVLVGIGFVYFDSIFFKSTSDLWRNGLGMWLPCSVSQNVFTPLHGLLNSKYLVLFLGYVTFLFEAIFIFTFFRKRWRIPLLIIGWGLHIGILVSYPIPWFALGMCTIYLLMVPMSWWDRLLNSRVKHPKMKFYYDGECPLCNRTKITIQHFDIRGRIEFKTVQFYAHKEPLFKGVPTDDLLDDIHSVKRGKVYKGLDTYIQVLESIPVFRVIGWFLRIPGVYHVGQLVYGHIAKNRTTERCTEGNCGFEPPVLPPDEGKFKILENYTLRDLKVFGLSIGLFVILIFQLAITYNSPMATKSKVVLGIKNNSLNRGVERFVTKLEKFTRTALGITHHGVFMDSHFNEYNHIVGVTYIDKDDYEIWLPIINKEGRPGAYISGFNWVKWTFRVNNNVIDQKRLEAGIRDFTAFWAKRNGVNLENAEFIIKMKKVDSPTEWEYGFLKKQMEKPWQVIGKAIWKDTQYSIQIPEVEKL